MQSKIDLLDTEYSNWQVTAQFYDQYSNTHWALMQRSQESNDWLNYIMRIRKQPQETNV